MRRHLEEAIELLVRSNDLPIADLDVLEKPHIGFGPEGTIIIFLCYGPRINMES